MAIKPFTKKISLKNCYPAGLSLLVWIVCSLLFFKETNAANPLKENILVLSDSSNAVNKDLVKFRVQIGLFKDEPPIKVLNVYAKLKDITGEKTPTGFTRYVIGSFGNYKDAVAFKNDIIKTYGLSDCFIVALYNNEYIPVPKALELLK